MYATKTISTNPPRAAPTAIGTVLSSLSGLFDLSAAQCDATQK